jgi:hypothetical protein
VQFWIVPLKSALELPGRINVRIIKVVRYWVKRMTFTLVRGS